MKLGGGRGCDTPHRDLQLVAPPKMDTFFRLEVYGKVWISLVEVYERVERTLSLHPKGQKAHFMDVKTPKSFLAH